MNGYNRTIKWRKAPLNAKVLQIYSKGLEYALVSPEYEQCHSFVWCKDFLHDIIFASIHNKWFEVYRFKFDPEVDPLPCLDRIRLLITNSKDKKFSSKIPATLDFINQIEDRLGIKKSFVRKCNDPPEGYENSGVFMFEGNKRWIQSPPMLSLYTLMLRVGFCHSIGDDFESTIKAVKNGDIKPYQKRDSYFLKHAESAFNKIIKIGDKKIFFKDIKLNYPVDMQINSLHNKMGIVGFSSDVVRNVLGEPVLIPHWHSTKANK